MNRQRGRRAVLWTIGSLVVVVGIVVGGWLLWPNLGFDSAQQATSAPTQRAPSIPRPTAPSPTPSATVTPLSDSGLSLVVDSDGSLWRSTDGACAEGISPKLERSPDAGATWIDVTPTSPDLREIIALNGAGAIQLEAVVLVGGDCRLAGIGTYTDGRFWQSDDRVLTDSTFIARGAVDVSMAGEQVAVPCEGAFDPVASADTLTVICPLGGLQAWVSGAWVTLTTSRVVSAAAAGPGRVVAIASATCEGVLISGFRNVARPTSGAQARCADGMDPSRVAVAVAAAGDQIYVWDGTRFRSVAIPSA